MRNLNEKMRRLAYPLALLSFITGTLFFLELQSCKHEPVTKDGQDSTLTSGTISGPIAGTDGAALYTNNCAGCHGSLATSTKLGTTAAKIQSGIANVNGMKSFSALSTVQIQAIADALKLSSTTTPIPVTDGATLYTNNCAGCHGPLATSAKLGTTAAKIQSGITNVNGMKSLSSLSTAQIQAIADALKLSSTPAPTPVTDGATLYATNCAGCHGTLASSAKLGATTTRIQNGISTVSGMKSLSTLTSTQIQAISTALTSTAMPTDGATLYAINCASCHGVLASSQVGSSSVSKIQSAIKGKSQMKYLATLTLTQITAISGALANIKGDD